MYFWSEISTVAARLLELRDIGDTRPGDGRTASATGHIGAPVANVREPPGSLQSSRRETSVAAKQNSQAAPDAFTSNPMELREALQKETLLNNALVGELAALRSELISKSAIADKAAAESDQTRRTAEVAELQNSARQEAERSAALTSELAKMRGEIEIQAAQSQKAADSATREKQAAERTIADLRQTLAQEQKKSAALIEDSKVASAKTAAAEQQRRALEEAQARATELTNDLARTRGEIEIQRTQSQELIDSGAKERLAAERTIADLRQTLAQEQKNSAALIEDSRAASAKTATAEPQRRALEEAQARVTELTNDLARTRGEIEIQRTQSQKAIDSATREKLAAERTIADLQQTLALEQKKAASLIEDSKVALAKTAEPQRRALEEAQARVTAMTSELARMRGEIEIQRTQSQKEIDSAAKEKLAAERTIADLRQTLALEQQKSAALIEDRKVAPARKAAVNTRAAVTPSWNGQAPRVAPAAKTSATELNKGTDAQVGEVGKLIARAATLIAQGNIGAARIVLERAAESGNARASFMLAETYDPIILSAWGTQGTRGEAMKAREHYAKAHAGGIQEAKGRLDALGR
ncbi:hypothetical protein [Bradyrhizobium sp.]|uniref:hypothetical protein n=1 Tax=Bradyrhizobium sp. TaxID=376 RepID=UPI002D1F9D55|nr:hypothetical protein [Bradyrhizobium sp.]